MEPKEVAIAAAKEAGSLLQTYKRAKIKVEQKDRAKSMSDIVTEADFAAEKIIIEKIAAAFPDHGILSEEAGLKKSESGYLWVIDPLDGTFNFLKGIDFCCVSIGLLKGEEAILGVIYAPEREELYVGERGKGATCNGNRIAVSSENNVHDAIIGSDSTSKDSEKEATAALLSLASCTARSVRTLGSSALAGAYVAAGKLDGFWKYHVNLWDHAASIVLIEEAGGTVTTLDGKPFTPESATFLASNGKCHEGLLKMLQST